MIQSAGRAEFVKVYNIELDSLYKKPFTGIQLSIILWTIRNSRGWNRAYTLKAGVRTVAKEINSNSIGSVRLALRVLVEYGVLKRDGNGGWALQEDISKWEVGGSKIDPGLKQTPGSKTDPVKGSKTDLGGGLKQTPFVDELKTTTKDRKTKKAGTTAPAGPYEIKNDTAHVICGYKVVLGFKFDDREWDKANFSRYTRAAVKFKNAFKGDVEAATDWLEAFAKNMEKAGRSWNLDTAAKIAWDEKPKRERADQEDDWERHKKIENGAAAWNENGRGI